MKIFNWVHKRFHHNTPNDGLASNVKNIEPTISNADSQALMKQVALADLLGGWKDGILTIGTLGCDPLNLKSFNQNKEYYALESEDELDDQDCEEHVLVEGEGEGDDDEDKYNIAEHEELNPLMHTTFEHNFEANASEEEAFNKESKEVESEQKKKKGERITLADLFLADSDAKMKMDPASAAKAKLLLHQSSEKVAVTSLKAKHGLSFTKKLIPRVKDNSHPIKDIKKLMKKMLKRKIHPELDVKNHKPEDSAAGIISDNHNNEANDTASLLPI